MLKLDLNGRTYPILFSVGEYPNGGMLVDMWVDYGDGCEFFGDLTINTGVDCPAPNCAYIDAEWTDVVYKWLERNNLGNWAWLNKMIIFGGLPHYIFQFNMEELNKHLVEE